MTGCYAVANPVLQLRRITTHQRFIPQIDGLRFVAISSVVLFHVYAALERDAIPPTLAFNTDLGKRGVELFFAIRAFILGVPFASHCGGPGPGVNMDALNLLRRYQWHRDEKP